MTDHEIYLKITTDDVNTGESFYNQIRKRAQKGNVEFGANIDVERISKPADVEGFEE